MRVFRTIFLLAAAAFLLPSPPEDPMAMLPQKDTAPASELLTAAVSTVADMGDFCSRQPAVCETAHYLAVKLEGKAKYSFALLYQWAQDSNGLVPAEQAYNGEGEAASHTVAAGATGRNTLRLDDLIPEWRAPKPAQG